MWEISLHARWFISWLWLGLFKIYLSIEIYIAFAQDFLVEFDKKFVSGSAPYFDLSNKGGYGNLQSE